MAKTAAVINDLSGFGKCSLTAYIAVLSAIGTAPCPIPTAVLTSQTNFPLYKTVDFTGCLKDYINIYKSLDVSFDGICSGYIANSVQVDFISEFIRTFANDDTLVLVDPVMADNGKIYPEYTDEMCRKMGELVKQADFITPNLTELCILSDNDYHTVSNLPFRAKISAVEEMAYKLAEDYNQTVAVTGIVDGDSVYNGVFGKSIELLVRSDYYNVSFSGTGDLFSAAFFGCLLKGRSIQEALQTAAKFIERSVADTISLKRFDPNFGVEFERHLSFLQKE